jgi:hypothetical protein
MGAQRSLRLRSDPFSASLGMAGSLLDEVFLVCDAIIRPRNRMEKWLDQGEE